MLICIDQSGCSGFKLTKNSTPYLFIGLIIFKDFSEAEKAGKAMQELKKSLNIQPAFTFNKDSFRVIESVLNEICQYDFEIRVLIADKVGIEDQKLRENSDLFYEYLTRTLIKNNEDIFKNASIKINKNIDKRFKRILNINLHIHHEFKNIKFNGLKKDSLIQLTDMMIGVIAKNYTDESIPSYQLFNKLLENKKIKSIWKIREASDRLNTLH
ncbi:MAG: DUF3800 domain-containing protein [Gammaproteobacteria bacterium]|nr:DUF3800 domain-containing protein [Gammaproteobacteria bacterium]